MSSWREAESYAALSPTEDPQEAAVCSLHPNAPADTSGSQPIAARGGPLPPGGPCTESSEFRVIPGHTSSSC
ncbi:hypothetical protein SKAU_G00316900 [Synaphobranchus kaupii]|uniref:Uncharacterized protein n=1 Tax=Synaphobranchus kaupii TaxID=118154 RepID=A0A9Q1ESS0_SYNKA|nr:hypothetical protein SKAU_G00316900 [Synaphobranchus kaupii]